MGLKVVRCVEWREQVTGALRIDGKPIYVATTDQFAGEMGIFIADGRGGLIVTRSNAPGIKSYPVAGWGDTPSAALQEGEKP